ncbi:unnamed protein product [Rotaria sp. Silwood1]|nr:unnamed protein product [Rotaria sp. Silwood1]
MNVDAIDDRRRTPLHVACENGHTIIVKFLLEKGASSILRDARSYNCLDIAIIGQHEELVKELLNHDSWRDIMRNAQPISGTEAFDTPMRKLIRYVPNVAAWLIDEKFTTIVGGPGQKPDAFNPLNRSVRVVESIVLNTQANVLLSISPTEPLPPLPPPFPVHGPA